MPGFNLGAIDMKKLKVGRYVSGKACFCTRKLPLWLLSLIVFPKL